MVMTQAQAADTLRDLMNIVLGRKVKEALKIAVESLKKNLAMPPANKRDQQYFALSVLKNKIHPSLSRQVGFVFIG